MSGVSSQTVTFESLFVRLLVLEIYFSWLNIFAEGTV